MNGNDINAIRKYQKGIFRNIFDRFTENTRTDGSCGIDTIKKLFKKKYEKYEKEDRQEIDVIKAMRRDLSSSLERFYDKKYLRHAHGKNYIENIKKDGSWAEFLPLVQAASKDTKSEILAIFYDSDPAHNDLGGFGGIKVVNGEFFPLEQKEVIEAVQESNIPTAVLFGGHWKPLSNNAESRKRFADGLSEILKSDREIDIPQEKSTNVQSKKQDKNEHFETNELSDIGVKLNGVSTELERAVSNEVNTILNECRSVEDRAEMKKILEEGVEALRTPDCDISKFNIFNDSNGRDRLTKNQIRT